VKANQQNVSRRLRPTSEKKTYYESEEETKEKLREKSKENKEEKLFVPRKKQKKIKN
jgi:hypothetical protein